MLALLARTALLFAATVPQEPQAPPASAPRLEPATIEAALRTIGLEFDGREVEAMARGVQRNRDTYARLRDVPLTNDVPPATVFVPLGEPPPSHPEPVTLPPAERPADLDELGFASLRTLASLVKSRRVSCVELVELSLRRLQRFDPKLRFTITTTPERALARARELDAMLDAGEWLGLLHGIPFGAKDLLSATGHPTTWGATPYQDQVIDRDARVIENLERRGAILVAKLSLGALAMGDVWFGATTRNPWNPEQGSSGSSAGSASATAAGAVPFAVGSETLGSIVSPSARCGCSSLRPTFGVVPTDGAMALSWTMDKLGPLCRSAEDAAIAFAGMLDDDPPRGYRFHVPTSLAVRGMRVGYLADAFDDARNADDRGVLDELRGLGVELVPVALPDRPARALTIVLSAEAAAAFDALTRGDDDDRLVRQDPGAWPNLFRTARLIPAVEFVNAQRIRTLLMRETAAALAGVDAVVHPTFAGEVLALSNLTGHPAFVAPRGWREDGTPRSIGFLGQVYGEQRLLRLVQAWQAITDHHTRRPPQ